MRKNRLKKPDDFHGNVLLKSMEIEKMPEVDGFIHFCYDALMDRKLLIEGECLEMTESGKRRLAANRFFIQSEGRYTFLISGGRIARLASSLLFSWTVFFCLYWVGMKYVLPRLPTLALWDSLDRLILSLAGLELSLFRLIQS
jgi:hypothetical protein